MISEYKDQGNKAVKYIVANDTNVVNKEFLCQNENKAITEKVLNILNKDNCQDIFYNVEVNGKKLYKK